MSDAHDKMDRMYRYQRHFYDVTRKFYLLGRDHLIEKMDIRDGQKILEIGCGTGRNLAILANKYPQAEFFGLDASSEMLESAITKVKKQDLGNVILKMALADDFDYSSTFGLTEPLDTVFFSYSISMIPTWRESVDNALKNVKSGRVIYFVDFYDQRDLPSAFAGLLQGWLKRFHVKYPEGLIPYLTKLEDDGLGESEVTPLFRSYSFLAEFRKK